MAYTQNVSKGNYLASLEKGSKKHPCPQCGRKTLHRYVTRTGEYLPEQYGRCDRVNNCAYYLSPYSDGFINTLKPEYKPQAQQQPRKPAFIPADVVLNRIESFEQNTFIRNLATQSEHIPFPFDLQDLRGVIKLYSLGTITAGHMAGAICFPFIDIDKNVRAVQCKVFDDTNHTVKGRTDWLHSIIERHYRESGKQPPPWLSAYLTNETKVTCLFGEHLLSRFPKNPVCLVEAPKSAVIACLYYGLPTNENSPLWLAVGSLSYLTLNRCKVLKNRNVFLFPDLSPDGRAFDLWDIRANEFNEVIPGATFETVTTLEKYATDADRNAGADVADLLIKLDWRKLRQTQVKHTKPYPANDWSTITREEIKELEGMLDEVLRRGSPRLPEGVVNVTEFIRGHMEPIRNGNGIGEHISHLIKFISNN